MLQFSTAGESHGPALIALLSGLPAGLPVDFEFVQRELLRRQLGFGRGARQRIERDTAEFLGGVYHGKTIGAPVAVRIENRDWSNWQMALPVEATPANDAQKRPLTAPRPGHADLAGALKFNFHDARFVLERASARETAARVAAGALAKLLLREFGVEVLSHVVQIGAARLGREGLSRATEWSAIQSVCDNLESPLRCIEPNTEQAMKAEIEQALRAGNSVGGVFEVVAHHVPPGLGSHAQWNEKLDGMLAQAIMSIQSIKAVEIGSGFNGASQHGSAVQDEIQYDRERRRFTRSSNRAGGVEGGISNGEDVVVCGYMKPISTLRTPLESADLGSKEAVRAAYERSDVCVVPAGGIIGESMVALVLAGAFLVKFGGDSLAETRRNFEGYQRQLDQF